TPFRLTSVTGVGAVKQGGTQPSSVLNRVTTPVQVVDCIVPRKRSITPRARRWSLPDVLLPPKYLRPRMKPHGRRPAMAVPTSGAHAPAPAAAKLDIMRRIRW
ncbi:unnamed protein product, partial [Ectocarpus sp. 13 AM-2016]